MRGKNWKGVAYIATDFGPDELIGFVEWLLSHEARRRMRSSPTRANQVIDRPYLWLLLDGKPMWVVEGPEG